MSVTTKDLTIGFLLCSLLALGSCDLVDRLTGKDPVAQVTRNNPVDPGVSTPMDTGLQPADKSTIGQTKPTLQWLAAQGVAEYRVQVSTTDTFDAPLVYEASGIKDTRHQLDVVLAPNRTYYWRVQPRYADGTDAGWSQSWSFEVKVPVPVPVAPAAGSVTPVSRPTFSWSCPSLSGHFIVQVSDTQDFSGPVLSEGTSTTLEWMPDAVLANDKRYYWRVCLVDENGVQTDWSAPVVSFDIKLSVPLLTSPPSGSVVHGQRPDLYWSSGPGGQWHVQVNKSQDFSGPPADDVLTSSLEHLVGSNLDLNTRYYWRVSTVSFGVQGDWSPPSSFDVALPIPTLVSPAAGGTVSTARPTLQWYPTSASCTVQISQSAGFSGVLTEEGSASGGGYQVVKVLANNTRYYWRVRIVDPSGVLGDWSAARDFLVALPRPPFAPGVRYAVPTPSFVLGNTAIGDFNGDGKKDVAVLEWQGSRLLVYYQGPGGTLGAPVLMTTGLITRGIAAADVNNDGFDELVVCGNNTASGTGSVAVFRQDGPSHGLGSPQYYPLASANVDAVVVADLNGDGLPDVACAGRASAGNGLISLLFQGPGGTLGPEVVYGSCPVQPNSELHAADMNADGRCDLVVQSGPKQLSVIMQMSPGVFSSTPDNYTVQTSYWPFFSSFSLGDLNSDGRADIAVSDLTGNLNIFLQGTGGSFARSILPEASDEELIADMDGDGLNDIVTFSGGIRVSVRCQAPGGTFLPPSSYSMPTSSSGGTAVHGAMSTGDVTGDGLPDIVTSWSNEGIFVLARVP